MGFTDIIVIAVIILIVGGATAYVIRAKKRGQKCIGCPDSKICAANGKTSCSGSCASCNGCHSND